MSHNAVIDLIVESLFVAMKISAPALLSIMVAGILISLLQAATQINEQTLSFIPKIIAMTLALIFSGSWILQTMVYFTSKILMSIALVTK
ncbi:MAG: flagellar biosynthesis protein FliQ [Oligoflexales bacterium]|nr:flagellar biosynthesis protein FliQ [Oligoflexales bacterium]